MVLLGFTSMIIKEFSFAEDQLHYFVGLGSLIIKKLKLDDIFNLIEIIQKRYDGVMLQFFNRKLILNYNHIFYACYHTLKTFRHKKNISNKMGIEFLLYLSADRQIKRTLENYGITIHNIKQGTIDFCVISNSNNLEKVRMDLLKERILTSQLFLSRLIENQIKAVLKSYRILTDDTKPTKNNIGDFYLTLEDLICEKMVLLSLEKTSYELESVE